MGLDVTLGILVLIAAIRGWFKGFVLQAIGLSALISCVYLADPIREFARPHARDYLPTIQPELLDRLLWWTSAALAFFVVSGVGKGIQKAARRRPYGGEVEPNRGDQGAGFLLGGLKGAVVAAFLAAALVKHSPEYLKAGGYVEEQVRTSKALAWAQQYRPAERIWFSPPVQSFITHVRQRGLWEGKVDAPDAGEPLKVESSRRPEPPPVRTAERPHSLAIPPPGLDPRDPDFLPRFDEALRRDGVLKSR